MDLTIGDIVLCKFYFSDLKQDKNRPVLVFKDNLPHHDFIATPTISNQISKIHTDALILQLQNVKDVLQERFGIEEIALFGSYSRGEATENSDVDIAILKMDKKELFIF